MTTVTPRPKAEERTFHDVYLGGWETGKEIKLETESSQPEQVSRPRERLWNPDVVGTAEGEGTGEGRQACSQLALILCDDIQIVGKHESRVVRTRLSDGPGTNPT